MDPAIGLDLKTLIRTVPDFPRPGVMFRDITTLLKHPDALHAVAHGWRAWAFPCWRCVNFQDIESGWRVAQREPP